ncbi:DUF2029 domain-containing protein [bacterium]|nr:DUF2029 domain-containing protein [bacterium]
MGITDRQLQETAASDVLTHLWAWLKESWSGKLVNRFWIILGAVAIVTCGYLSVDSLVRVNLEGNDLTIFYQAGNSFYAGEQVYEPGYWKFYNPPFFAALVGLLGWLPQTGFYIVYGLLNIILTLLCIKWLYQLIRGTQDPRVRTRFGFIFTLTFLGTAAFWYLNLFVYGQSNILVLALVLGGLVQTERGRDVYGGLLLGLATALKLTPVVFLAYFLLRGRWKLVCTAAGVFLAANGLVPLLVRSVEGTIQLYNDYYRFFLQPALLSSQQVFYMVYHDKNVSLTGALARYLTEPVKAGALGYNLLALSPMIFSFLTKVVNLLALSVTTVTLWRKPRSTWERMCDYSLVFFVVFLLNNVTWCTHLIGLLLPLSLIFMYAESKGWRGMAVKLLVTWPIFEGLVFLAKQMGFYHPSYILMLVSSTTLYLIFAAVWLITRRTCELPKAPAG